MQVVSVIEQLMFATVRITTTSAGSGGLGTGFIYSDVSPITQLRRLFLVTNKHVIAGADTSTIHFIADGGGHPLLGQEFPITVNQPELSFRGHPDPDIDITMMPLERILDVFQGRGQRAFYRSIPHTVCADEAKLMDYEPIEPVTFIGYPNGLFDSASLLPIVRRGHSATALTVDYGGKPIFLIDASVFPGSSGSPVFLLVPASTPDKHGDVYMGRGPQLLFLGVVAAVYQRDVPVLTGAGAPYINEMLDLGIVYKASAVAELAQLFPV